MPNAMYGQIQITDFDPISGECQLRWSFLRVLFPLGISIHPLSYDWYYEHRGSFFFLQVWTLINLNAAYIYIVRAIFSP